jgi:hypothetical protein
VATTFIASLRRTSRPLESSAGSTAGEDVDGRVVVGLEDDAVGGGWLREPVDLGLEGDDLLAGLLEGAHEALVLGGDRREVGLEL